VLASTLPPGKTTAPATELRTDTVLSSLHLPGVALDPATSK